MAGKSPNLKFLKVLCLFFLSFGMMGMPMPDGFTYKASQGGGGFRGGPRGGSGAARGTWSSKAGSRRY